MTIAERVREILDQAIDQVSSSGEMKFSLRNLFYAVLELYKKRFTGEKFYKYNSFTQDFMRTYVKRHGKIEGLARGKRGLYQYPQEWSSSSEEIIRPDIQLWQGIGNKIIVVEKAGLYDAMRENQFDVRLDAVIMTTEGFCTEAGREVLLMAERRDLPICILHDFDVNGKLIHSTLKEPTKRLDTYLKEALDLGLNWEIINELMESRGLTPEPVYLSKQDRSKLDGMYARGELAGGEDEYEFLQKGRIELNALRPLELLKWLEERLEALDLWKTVPEQDELDEKLKEDIISELDETKVEIVSEIVDSVKEKLGLTQIEELIEEMEEAIRILADQEIAGRFEDVDYPIMMVQDFEEKLREDMLQYWTRLCLSIAGEKAEELREPIKDKIEDDRDDIVSDTRQDEQIQDHEKKLYNAFAGWLANR